MLQVMLQQEPHEQIWRFKKRFYDLLAGFIEEIQDLIIWGFNFSLKI